MPLDSHVPDDFVAYVVVGKSGTVLNGDVPALIFVSALLFASYALLAVVKLIIVSELAYRNRDFSDASTRYWTPLSVMT
jgi:L-asparagine transporter-like permease